MNSRSCGGQRRRFLRETDYKVSAMKIVVFAAIPNRGYIRFAIRLRQFAGSAPLLIYISLDHLRSQTRSQFPVLSAFKQNCNDDVRIASRGKPNEPSILRKI